MMSTHQWGYDRADCIGDHALSLFLDDLEAVLAHYANQDAQTEALLFQAQMASNKLVQAYDAHARATRAFSGQSIEIRRIINAQDRVEYVPIFSAGLRSHLVTLLERSMSTTRH